MDAWRRGDGGEAVGIFMDVCGGVEVLYYYVQRLGTRKAEDLWH